MKHISYMEIVSALTVPVPEPSCDWSKLDQDLAWESQLWIKTP